MFRKLSSFANYRKFRTSQQSETAHCGFGLFLCPAYKLEYVNPATVAAVTHEFQRVLPGGIFTRVSQLSKASFAIDLRLHDSLYLFISVEPGSPRTYLIKRRQRELDKVTGTPGQFALALMRELSDATLTSVDQIPNERIIRINFAGTQAGPKELVVQLTGISANIFLLDHNGIIIDSSRENHGEGQEIGMAYAPPEQTGTQHSGEPFAAAKDSISAALDGYYSEKDRRRVFMSLANSARSRLDAEIGKREKLIRNLENDLRRHGDADKWKRFGDLLLANISTATRTAGKITLVDYFDDALPKIDIEADDNDEITEAAEKYFKRYTKSRNAADEIDRRMNVARGELKKLREEKEELEEAIESGDPSLVDKFSLPVNKSRRPQKAKRTQPATATVYRTFLSSDGYEILVGKKAKDNDFLTFRVAKSLDTWMHAADYPGSHIVIRNPSRRDIPHRTLVEAAKFAAFYSQGKKQTKAAVHYTQRKFVHKPKGAAPGLVSLASFKTLLVEPTPPDIKEK